MKMIIMIFEQACRQCWYRIMGDNGAFRKSIFSPGVGEASFFLVNIIIFKWLFQLTPLSLPKDLFHIASLSLHTSVVAVGEKSYEDQHNSLSFLTFVMDIFSNVPDWHNDPVMTT